MNPEQKANEVVSRCVVFASAISQVALSGMPRNPTQIELTISLMLASAVMAAHLEGPFMTRERFLDAARCAYDDAVSSKAAMEEERAKQRQRLTPEEQLRLVERAMREAFGFIPQE